MLTLSIGKLAKATDVKVPTIRFYEDIGLLPKAKRTESDRRIYGDETVKRLAFIRHARQLGFSVDAIRTLLHLADHPDLPCEDASVLASRHLASVESKIVQLEALRVELGRLTDPHCRGSAAECRVLDALGGRG